MPKRSSHQSRAPALACLLLLCSDFSSPVSCVFVCFVFTVSHLFSFQRRRLASRSLRPSLHSCSSCSCCCPCMRHYLFSCVFYQSPPCVLSLQRRSMKETLSLLFSLLSSFISCFWCLRVFPSPSPFGQSSPSCVLSLQRRSMEKLLDPIATTQDSIPKTESKSTKTENTSEGRPLVSCFFAGPSF